MIKLIIVGGPTSSGKTRLALQLAREFNGELINADSRQIYKYLDIGTNKGRLQKSDYRNQMAIEQVPIHLIGFLNPDQRFSVYEYKKLAEEKIHEIHNRGKVPILVGGTGLYIDSIIKDYRLKMKDGAVDLSGRKLLEGFSVSELQNILKEKNKEVLNNLNESDRNNPRRLIRLIEKEDTSYKPLAISHKQEPSGLQTQVSNLSSPISNLFLYPEYNWDQLKLKIENRVEEMFKEGIIEETKKVLDMGFPKDSVALQGIGYREVLDYLDGKADLKATIEKVKTAHKQYARRQRTWFEGKGRGYELVRVKDIGSAREIVKRFVSE